MADVFISYKRENRPVVERLSSALQQLGFEVWWDFELLSGEDFRQVIRAVIDQCKAAVVVWSKASVVSSFVLDEASYALRLGRLCPVQIEAVGLPFGFGQVHVNDLSEWDGELSHPGFQALVKSIEERVGRRARLGAGASPLERQTAAAELEAFKAAQLAGNVGALRTFTANFPSGAFAAFVRDQIETIEAEKATEARMRAAATQADSPRTTVPTAGSARRRPTWPLIAGGLAVTAAAGLGLFMFKDAMKQAQEQVAAARAKAQEDSATAEKRARELEQQAAAERAARERAEKQSASLRQQADRDRQARDQAATRAEAERKQREAAFSVSGLHRDVRAAVEAARLNLQRAESAAARARAAASLAETAAERARAGVSGTMRLSFESGAYLGEGSVSTRNGYGISTFHAPSIYAGDRYAGQYKDNGRNGVGIYTFGKNANNTANLLQREGEFEQNKPTGLSVLLWVSGERHAGQWRDGLASGPGVRTYRDGRRYEGEYAAGKSSGYGVLWSADGRVISAGIWKDGKLVTPLAP